MRLNKIIFRLCWKHKKCAQTVFNMEYPLCNSKKCIMSNSKSSVYAYKKTVLGGKI